jgi:hypothetical protein
LLRLARLPSLIFSILTLVIITWHFRKDKTQFLFSLIIFGANFPLIHFGTEARGYSSLFFFSILSFFLIDKIDQRKKTYWAFQISQCLGFLSHLSFSSIALSLGIKFFIRKFNEEKNIYKSIWKTIKLETPSLVFVILLYFINIRHIKVGGGPQRPILGFLNDMSDLFLSRNHLYAVCLGCLYIVFLFLSYKKWVRKGFWRFENIVFGILLFIIVPLFNFIFSTYYFSKSPPFPRHFIVSYIFLLIFFIPILAQEFNRKLNSRLVCVVSFLVFFLFANFQNFKEFYSHGRGEYKKAVEYINKNSKGKDIVITCINFRDCSMASNYIGQYGDKTKRFFIVPYSANRPKVEDHWAIRAYIFNGETLASSLRMFDGYTLNYVAEFPSALFSGATWALYKNNNPESSQNKP